MPIFNEEIPERPEQMNNNNNNYYNNRPNYRFDRNDEF